MAESKVIPERLKLSDAAPSTQAHDDAAAAGSTEEVARSGHKHGMPTAGTLSVSVGTFIRDMTLASGTQTISGLGITPKAVICHAANSASAGNASFGFSSSAANQVQIDDHQNVANEWSHLLTEAIAIEQGGANRYDGAIGNFQSGSFDVVWTRNGAPTGTMRVVFIAIG